WKPTEDLTVLLNVHGAVVANRPAEYRHLGLFDSTGGPNCTPSEVLRGIAADGGECVDAMGYGTPKNFYAGAYNRRQHLDVNNWGGSLRADYTIDTITITSITAYEHSDKLHPEDTDSSPNRELEINFGVDSNTFTQELRASQTTDDYTWVVGAYYLSEVLHQDQPLFILLDAGKFPEIFGNGDGVAEIAYDHSRQGTQSMALYGQSTFKIADGLNLTL